MTLDTFANVAQLAARLGRTIAEDDARALQILADASAAIRNEARQTINLVEGDVQKLRGSWSQDLWLPERPVADVTTITLSNTLDLDSEPLAATGYDWDRLGLLRRTSGHWGGSGATVTVTYDHGYDPIPDDLVALCIQIASRLYTNPDGTAQETIGSYSYSAGDAGRSGIALHPDERKVCWRYRQRTAP